MVLGEERGETGSGSRRWIIDAIDGTHNFAKGSPDWGTLIALEVEGRIVCGVCNQPTHRRRYWATHGFGAFWTPSPDEQKRLLSVSDTTDVSLARSFIPSPEWWRSKDSDRIAANLLAATRPEAPSNHPAVQVAEGTLELGVFWGAGPWDLAAPSIIVEEAGGRFTDVRGEASIASGNGIFSNGKIHEAILSLTAA